MPIDLSLWSKSSCQTLSNALDISKKTDLTSRDGLQSKASNISCVIASNWFIHESDGRNPDWFGFSSFSFTENNVSKYFSKNGQKRYWLIVIN